MTRITGLRTADVRFPTSRQLDGSDAMNPDPDYSAAYVVLETDGRAVGILGDKELYHALLGKNLEKAGEDVAPPAVRSTLSQAG